MIFKNIFEQDGSMGLQSEASVTMGKMADFEVLGQFGEVAAEPDETKRSLALREERSKALLGRLSNVALAGIDDDARDELGDDYLATPDALRDVDGSNYAIGAEYIDGLYDGDAYGAAEAMIETLPEAEREGWRTRLAGCQTDVDGTRLVGEMFRNKALGQYAEMQKKEAKSILTLQKMPGYVAGEDGALSEAELAELSGAMDAKRLEDARKVRSWMQTYVRPMGEKLGTQGSFLESLGTMVSMAGAEQAQVDAGAEKLQADVRERREKGVVSAEELMRHLDGLEDELFELIGQDEQRAAMAYEAMMHWAAQVAESNKVEATDEFVVAVGKKISNWADARGRAVFSTQPAVGGAGAINVGALESAAAQIQGAAEEAEERKAARAILRGAINRSMELGSSEGWAAGTGRTVAKMVGDTLLYLLPGGLGMAAGTADMAVSGMTERMDALEMSGLSGEAAAGRSAIETVAQGAAELLPWGRVGGMGLSGFLRWVGSKTGSKVGGGSISRWLINNTQKNTWRAVVAEGAANFIDEGVLEPVASGLMQFGAERTFDLLGVPHGESRSWVENFEELGQIWGDSRQLAALAIFSAGLSGAGIRGIHENVLWFAENRKMWLAMGLSEQQVDEVMASKDPLTTGMNIRNEEWKNRSEEIRARQLEFNKELKDRGEVLVLTGAGALDAELANNELAKAYAGVWATYADKGWLPHVEQAENGMVRIWKAGKDGEENAVDLVLAPEDADAFLQGEFNVLEQRMLKAWQQMEGQGSDEAVNLKRRMLEDTNELVGGAMLREAEKSGVVRVEDITQQLPPDLATEVGALIKDAGGVNRLIAEKISDWARGMIAGLVASGVSEAEARASKEYAEGAVMSLGSLENFAAMFAERGEMVEGSGGEVYTTLFRSRGGKESVVNGIQVLGSTMFAVPGRASGSNVVEDVAESVFDEMVQARAVVLAGEQNLSYADAEKKAWTELAGIVGRARSAVLKADASVHIPEPKANSPLSVTEAFSAIARNEFILSGVTPAWMAPLVEAAKGTLTAAAAVGTMKKAWAAALEADPQAAGALADLLEKVGVRVGEALAGTRIEAQDVVAWRVAHGYVMSHANGPEGVGGVSVSETVRAAEDEEQAILAREAPASEETLEEVKQEQARAEEQAERLMKMQEQGSNAPEQLQGVFDGDTCAYNATGGYWFGMIQKSKLTKSTEQVKVGSKGKHGVIAGRELVGNFQASAAPLYVWKRKNGELWLISGRHRFELMMRDNGVDSHPCYVFLEDAEHDEKWARMMDYENNMRDDQADELTAATYVRETGLTDEELKVRGLMRNASRSKRGALIGRHAREELWTRFSNEKIKPIDAEIVCNLTRHIKDQSRVDEIQRRCCMLLEKGKSWDFIGGMVQLMVQAQAEQGEQVWFNFGADFEAALERAATWIEKALKAVNENIALAKSGRDMSGKKAEKAARLGISTNAGEDVQRTLQDLQVLKGKLELIGSYPELRQQAEMWDGVSDVDPVGWMLQQQALENERMAAEKEMEAEEYLKAQQAEATGLLSLSMNEKLDDFFEVKAGQDGVMDVPVGNLMMLKKEKPESVVNAWGFMREAAQGMRSRRGAVSVADNGDGTYTIVDGNATSLALAAHGASHVRVKVVGNNAGSRLNNSAYLVEEGTPGADADGNLRTHGLDGLTGDAAVDKAFEQAVENLPLLEKLVKAAADKVGGEMMMRPANDENGKATKKPSTAKDKANRDYQGDISRVVDLIGGTCVMPSDGDFYDAVKAIRKVLDTPEFKGGSVAKVKKLGFKVMTPQYRDIKVSVRFPNGGIGEIILVEEALNDAKFNRGGHLLYDVTRELEPYIATNKKANKAYYALLRISNLLYQTGVAVDSASFARAKSVASSALDALKEEFKNLSLSSNVAGMVKSSDSLLKKVKPASVVSAAMPSSSLIKNISKDMISNVDRNVNDKISMNMNLAEAGITFSLRTKPAPKKTGVGYKVFYQKDGKLYPPMVANPGGANTPVGVWLDADEGVRAGTSKTGRPQVKAGGKGTQGGSGTLAYRPGWHLGKIPYALQFNRKNPVTGERDLFPADFVWAEVEYAADENYQEEAMKHGLNKNGRFQHSLAGLPRIPEDGYYEYRTNPDPRTDPWIITGAMKVNRVLSKAEVDELVRAAGREPQQVQGGITFSVIGPRAKTWDKYDDARKFTGRDDGLQRVEIDASQAKLKWEVLQGKNVAAYRQIIADWSNLPKDKRKIVESFAELCWERDEASKLLNDAEGEAFEEGYRKAKELAVEADGKRDEVRKVIGRFFEQKGADGSVAVSVKNEIIDAMSVDFWSEWASDKVEDVLKSDPLEFGMELQDILDYQELYEAYPELREVPVYTEDLKGYYGLAGNNGWSNYIMMNRSLLSDGKQFYSTLLHEVQHVIQRIEGFARGGNTKSVVNRLEEIARKNDIEIKVLGLDMAFFTAPDYARDYLRSARSMLKNPKRAVKRSGLAAALRRLTDSPKETAERCVQELQRLYNELVIADKRELRRKVSEKNRWKYALPVADFTRLESIEAALTDMKKLESRRGYAPGKAPKLAREISQRVRSYEQLTSALNKYRYEPYELYARLAGEIESRNVESRLGWSAEQRAAMPFNETLEYPGEALVSFSMERVTQRSMELLEARGEEEVAQDIMADLKAACERLSVVLADDDVDTRRGTGLKVYAEMQALMSAVRAALPEKYLKQGNLDMLLRWASVYAQMAQNGNVPARGTIKGKAFDMFVDALQRQAERDRLQGMTEEDAREALMEIASDKLETAFLKVARDSVRRLDQFLKDRALERIEWLYTHAYPTREEGKAWSRGKMDAENYRIVNAAWALVRGSLDKRKEVENEMRALRRVMRSVREEMKEGKVPEEEGKRRLKKLNEQMQQKELEAMKAAAEDQANAIKAISDELEALSSEDAGYERDEAAANEKMALQQTFGNWYYKDALEARRAARVFENMVLRGKKQWEEKLLAEREEMAYWREQILAGFEVSREEATNVRMAKRNEYRTALNKQLIGMGKGFMNLGHLMLALRPLLGQRFCEMKREQISQMHTNTMAFNTELKGWMFETLREITGLQTEEAQAAWLQEQNMAADTGIYIREREVRKAVLTHAEAKRWLAMTAEQVQTERARLIAEAAEKKRRPSNVPTDSMLEDLKRAMKEYEADNHGIDPKDKKFRLQSEETWTTQLHTTKDAILFGILTFEQPDYEHLMEANGITPETLDQMRRYVGPKMLQWGYAMRAKLSEHGVNVARVFEEYTGIPFDARESYFKGVFDQGALKEQTLEQAVSAASGASGTGSKYGSLIPRRYHQSKINWDTSAAGVFVTSMQQQNNYVQTAKMVRGWRALLMDKAFSARVEAEIGAGAMQQIRGWIELIEGAAVADVKMAELSKRTVRLFLNGWAKACLGGNIRTLIKQVSALLNGYAGGYVPDSWMLNNELCQEMTYHRVGFGEYMMALARVMTMRGGVSREEMKAQPYIYARQAVDGESLLHVSHLAANQKLPGQVNAEDWLGWKAVPKGVLAWLGGKAERVVEKAMNAIAIVDAEMCTASAMAIADVAYRNAKEQDKDGVIPDDVKRAEALRIAGMALDVAGQPQLRTQKGYWAASGAMGGLGDFLFMFRSDTLSKAGLWIAQMSSGEKKAAAGGWLAFGVMNSLVIAALSGFKGNLWDDDDEWWQLGAAFLADVATNDLSALPIVGDVLGKVRSFALGERYFESGGLAEMVPFVDVLEYGKREWKNIEKGASWDRHWNTTAGLLRAVGRSCAICQESTIGPLANLSSLTMAAAVLGNTTQFVEGLIKLGIELEERLD